MAITVIEETDARSLPGSDADFSLQHCDFPVDACYFPTQKNLSKSDSRRCFVDIPLKTFGQQKSVSEAYPHLQPDVLATTWAVLLGCYTGQESVSFGFRYAFWTTAATCERRHASHEKEVACHVELKHSEFVSKIARNIEQQLDARESCRSSALRPYNTIVRYQGGIDCVKLDDPRATDVLEDSQVSLLLVR